MGVSVLFQRLMRGSLGVERPSEIARLLPGVVLAVIVMLVAFPVADLVGAWILQLQGIEPAGKSSPVSGVLVAILVGIVVGNLLRLSDDVKTGIRFSVTKLLRLGIILVGIKLSLLDVLKLGVWGIPIVVVAIASGLLFVSWFTRLLKLPGRLGTLIAAGTSICGVTAILSTAPVIRADEKEISYAIANVTLFGLLGMFLYPYVTPLVLQTSEQVGLFLGTAVHETSQVVGAALTYKEIFRDDVALKAATVTKLTRNLFLVVVVPLLALLYLRRQAGVGTGVKIKSLFPLFVLGFVAMALLRSLGDLMLQNGATMGGFDLLAWRTLTAQIGDLWGSKYLLGTAMAAVGLSTNFSVFKGVGLKPFVVGLVGALLVGVVGLIMALFLGAYVHL